MKYTTNYNLKKPESTDNVNIQDIDDNMDAIDIQMKNILNSIPSIPVTKVNGKTGDVVLAASDVGAATAAQGAKADSALQTSQLGQTGGVAKQDDLTAFEASTNSSLADNTLFLDDIRGTIQYPTIVNNQITEIDHKNGATVIRSDVFTFATNLITEVRTIIATGKTVTLKYHTDTLQVEVI